MRWIAILIMTSALAGAPALAAAQAPPSPPAGSETVTPLILPPAPLKLPEVFDGWVEAGKPQRLTTAAQADSANVAALKEYGFTGGLVANYKRDGETLTLRALRFHDVSGSYGAYSYYRPNGWPKVDVGTGGASDNNRVIFWKGTTVVQARFSQVGSQSAEEMREIARRLPSATGNRALLPPVLAFLPQGSMQPQTTHYALGPAGYAGSGGVLPPSLVGFNQGAEAITANYGLSSGTATLTIINYPEPQMAAAREQKIRAYLKSGGKAQPPFTKALQNSDQASLEVRRSGPLVAIVSGDAIPDQSHRLIEMVHYSADLTDIPVPGQSQVALTSQLLMGISVIVLIGAGAAILLGFFLGGGRALYRIARGKPASTVFDEEFIHLDLREEWDDSSSEKDKQHPNG